MLLAILLGPHAAFLSMASVLVVQGLFFADGGLLAMGANIFNMGFLPCYVVYPLLYRPLAAAGPIRADGVLPRGLGPSWRYNWVPRRGAGNPGVGDR